MFWCFDELFSKRLQKVDQFVKKHEKSSIWPNLWNFSNKLPCLCISINFSGKSCKKCLISWKRTGNHRSGQTGNFSSKLPCLGIFMNFSERSCKKCLISWESTRNNPFHQNLQLFEKTTMFGWTLWQKVAKTASFREKARKLMDLAETMQLFRTNYHVLVFRWTVEQKFAKSCSIREKARKIIDLAKTMQVSEQTAMSLHFDELFGKKLQKMPHFVKKHEKSSIWPKLCNLSNKLPCVCISMNFSGKSCKKCLISWKSTKNHQFGKNFPLFEKTTLSWHFPELLSKELQKLPHSVENHENSSIWPKLCNFF